MSENTRPQPSADNEALKRMTAMDDELEAAHPGWMTGMQPSAEPVAVWREIKRQTYWRTNYNENPDEAAVAIIASALEAARREALEQADEGGEGMTISDKLAALKAKRDALNAEIALIEVGIQRAAYDACLVEQYLRFNERRLAEGKRQLSASEYAAGVFDEEAS